MDADSASKPWSSAGSDDVDSSTDWFRRSCRPRRSRLESGDSRFQRLVLRLQAVHVFHDVAPCHGELCFRHLLHSTRIDG